MSDSTGVDKENLVMEHLVSLTYRERLTPNLNRFVDALLDARLIGHKCPACGRVYIPSKGYCPMCVVATGEADEVAVSDVGTLTGFTIITPVQYYGQKASEPFVYASVLLDGSDTTLGGQDIVGLPHEQLRTGLRVRAVWRPRDQRRVEGITNRGWGGLEAVIEAFEATGEPDADEDLYKEHIF